MHTSTGACAAIFHKGESFDGFTQGELNEHEWEINNRPRKVLDWVTPAEVFQELRSG